MIKNVWNEIRLRRTDCQNVQRVNFVAKNVRMGNLGNKVHDQSRTNNKRKICRTTAANESREKKDYKRNGSQQMKITPKTNRQNGSATKNCLLQNVLMQKMPYKKDDIRTRPDHKMNIFLSRMRTSAATISSSFAH